MKKPKDKAKDMIRDHDNEISDLLQDALRKIDPKIIQSIELVQRFSLKQPSSYKMKTSNIGTRFDYAQST